MCDSTGESRGVFREACVGQHERQAGMGVLEVVCNLDEKLTRKVRAGGPIHTRHLINPYNR